MSDGFTDMAKQESRKIEEERKLARILAHVIAKQSVITALDDLANEQALYGKNEETWGTLVKKLVDQDEVAWAYFLTALYQRSHWEDWNLVNKINNFSIMLFNQIPLEGQEWRIFLKNISPFKSKTLLWMERTGSEQQEHLTTKYLGDFYFLSKDIIESQNFPWSQGKSYLIAFNDSFTDGKAYDVSRW